MSCDQSLKNVFAKYHEIIRSCEDGILEDKDPIYLHDFRVNLRKTRSLLKHFKNYINDYSLNFADEFKRIASRTNQLRDLDVFLFSKDKYKSFLPSALYPELESFFDELETHKKNELKKVYKLIHSKEYRRIMKEWEILYSSEKSIFISPKNSPIKEIVSELVMKRFNKIIRKGEKLEPDSSDRSYHKLRIECKKLRYLIDSFSSLFPEKKINKLLKTLKKMQDVLGVYNDLCFQSTFLTTYLKKRPECCDLKESFDILLKTFESQKKSYKNSFKGIFSKFKGSENKKCYEALFGNK